MVEGVDKNGQRDFEGESLSHDGMNLLGKAGGELAKGRFDGFAKALKWKGFVRSMGPGTVALAGSLLPVAGGGGEEFLPRVVRVAGIGAEHTAFGQVRSQGQPAAARRGPARQLLLRPAHGLLRAVDAAVSQPWCAASC